TDSAKPDIETTLETLGDHARDDYANLEQLAEVLSDARGGEGRGFQLDFLQRMTRRLDLGRAYDSDTTRTTYRGGPSRIYTRLTASYGRHIAMRFAAEKDPGEPFMWAPDARWYGFDHVAGGLAVRDI